MKLLLILYANTISCISGEYFFEKELFSVFKCLI